MSFDPIAFLERAVPIASNERVDSMRDLLVETLAENGVDATVDDAGNTIATKGSGSPHVVLNTHVDTVSPHVEYQRVEMDGGESPVIRGRGSCDAKGPLAALMAAFLAVDPGERDGTGRLTLAITPDEETLSTGAHALVTDPEGLIADADLFIVGEPTGLDVCTAAKGRFEGTIHLSGVNAHAAEPDTGVNAVAAAGEALGALRTFDAEREAHPQLGEATLTATGIAGGESTNQVPSSCQITIDRRSVPPETADGFRDALLDHLRDAVPDAVGVDFQFTERETPFLEAFATDEDHELVTTLASAAAQASDDLDAPGGDVRPFTAATEASYFAPSPTVVFGPGVLADDEGAVAHADREYVRVAEVEAAAEAVEATLRRSL